MLCRATWRHGDSTWRRRTYFHHGLLLHNLISIAGFFWNFIFSAVFCVWFREAACYRLSSCMSVCMVNICRVTVTVTVTQLMCSARSKVDMWRDSPSVLWSTGRTASVTVLTLVPAVTERSSSEQRRGTEPSDDLRKHRPVKQRPELCVTVSTWRYIYSDSHLSCNLPLKLWLTSR